MEQYCRQSILEFGREKESLRSCGEEMEGVKRMQRELMVVVCSKPPGMKFVAAESWSRKPGIIGRPSLIPLAGNCQEPCVLWG